jgi:Glycosyl transferase family 11
MDRAQDTTPLVIARLLGGLGNQMFQYATGRALALRRGATLKLDITGFAEVGSHTERRYELDALQIQASTADDVDLGRFGRVHRAQSSRLDRVLRWLRIDRSRGAWPIYREPHFQFDSTLPELRAPVYLDGYWQSERYFSDIATLLQQEFAAKAPLDPKNLALARSIDAVNAVSLHVRRGDYVDNPATNRFHGICSLDYYQRALDYISLRVEAPHLFIFSDDQHWTRSNLLYAAATTFVDVNPPDRGYRDMGLMARCRHHIIANSSFSWWGAWLNPSREKIVIAPDRWFSASCNDTRDLIPADWVRL